MKKLISSILLSAILVPSLASATEDSWKHSFRSASSTALTSTQLSCVSTAIEVRENAIIAAHDAFSISIKNALTVRRDALKAAWNLSDKTARETARKSAWSAFKTSSQAAHNAMRTARVAAWTTFNASATVCGVKNHGEKSQKIENPTYSY